MEENREINFKIRPLVWLYPDKIKLHPTTMNIGREFFELGVDDKYTLQQVLVWNENYIAARWLTL